MTMLSFIPLFRRIISSLAIVLVGLVAMITASAQSPVITDVLDSGSYTETLVPGSVFVVKGSNLCSTSLQAAVPYQTTALAGVTIQLAPSLGGSAAAAYMIYTYCTNSATQLGALLDSTMPPGEYMVTVTTNGMSSAPFPTSVVTTKFAIMTLSSNGKGRGLVQNVVSQARYDLNGFTASAVTGATFQRSPASPGELMIVWGTGLGAAEGFDSTAPSAGLNFLNQGLAVTVSVAGMPVTPVYAGRSNLYPGLDNIVFQLPANVAVGCSVPIQVQVGGNGAGPAGGGQFSNIATVAIAPSVGAAACVDPLFSTAILARMDQGGSAAMGEFWLEGNNYQTNVSGGFSRIIGDQVGIASLFETPPGSCRIASTSDSLPEIAHGAPVLNAGTVTLTDPRVSIRSQALTQDNDNTYSYVNRVALDPQQAYSISGIGGTDTGPFSGTATPESSTSIVITRGIPAAFAGSGLSLIRSESLTIPWRGGGTDWIQVFGVASGPVAANSPILDTVAFVCTATADTGTITIPPSAMSMLPITLANPTGGDPTGANEILVIQRTRASAANGLFAAPLIGGGATDIGIFYAGWVAGGATVTYE